MGGTVSKTYSFAAAMLAQAFYTCAATFVEECAEIGQSSSFQVEPIEKDDVMVVVIASSEHSEDIYQRLDKEADEIRQLLAAFVPEKTACTTSESSDVPMPTVSISEVTPLLHADGGDAPSQVRAY